MNIGWNGLEKGIKWFRKESIGKESKYWHSVKEQKWESFSWWMNKSRDEKKTCTEGNKMTCLENRYHDTGRKEWDHKGKGNKSNNHRFRYYFGRHWKRNDRMEGRPKESEKQVRGGAVWDEPASPTSLTGDVKGRAEVPVMLLKDSYWIPASTLLPPSSCLLPKEDFILKMLNWEEEGYAREHREGKQLPQGTQCGRGTLSLLKHTQETAWDP